MPNLGGRLLYRATALLVHSHVLFSTQVRENLLLQGQERLTDTRQGTTASSHTSTAADRHQHQQLVVSSRFISSTHALRYDLAGELLSLFEKQCCRSPTTTGSSSSSTTKPQSNQGDGGGVAMYDFRPAEQHLTQSWMAKPVLDLDMPGFTFVSDQTAAKQSAELGLKLKQTRIPNSVVDAITAEVKASGPACAQRAVHVVETCISFLQGTGGDYVERLTDSVAFMNLSQYLTSVLVMRPEQVNEMNESVSESASQ
jgi:hypothetical protein